MRKRACQDRHRLIARALISAAEQDLPAPPNPYLVHHLSAHVATAGAWSDLAASDLLDHLVPVDVIVQRARTLLNRRRPEAAEHGLRVAVMRESQHTSRTQFWRSLSRTRPSTLRR